MAPKKNKKELETVVVIGDYRGSRTLGIYEVDENGEKDQYPVIAFGEKKAKAIFKHIEDLKKFVEE